MIISTLTIILVELDEQRPKQRATGAARSYITYLDPTRVSQHEPKTSSLHPRREVKGISSHRIAKRAIYPPQFNPSHPPKTPPLPHRDILKTLIANRPQFLLHDPGPLAQLVGEDLAHGKQSLRAGRVEESLEAEGGQERDAVVLVDERVHAFEEFTGGVGLGAFEESVIDYDCRGGVVAWVDGEGGGEGEEGG